MREKTAALLFLVSWIFFGAQTLCAEKTEEWPVPAAKAAVPSPVAPEPDALAEGRRVYEAECQPCHGKTGLGDGPKAQELEKKVADLHKRVPGQSDGALFWKISVGNKPMPSYKKMLSENERWSVVHYLRRLLSKEVIVKK